MTMPLITRESPDSPDARTLVEELEEALALVYPSESRHGYSVAKLIAQGVHFFVLREEGRAAACGGIQLFDDYGELKRMYVRPTYRRKGFGRLLLTHLAAHAQAHNIHTLRLETGIHQLEAIGLYERFGFAAIPPFGPYKPDSLSRCYEKRLTHPVVDAG